MTSAERASFPPKGAEGIRARGFDDNSGARRLGLAGGIGVCGGGHRVLLCNGGSGSRGWFVFLFFFPPLSGAFWGGKKKHVPLTSRSGGEACCGRSRSCTRHDRHVLCCVAFSVTQDARKARAGHDACGRLSDRSTWSTLDLKRRGSGERTAGVEYLGYGVRSYVACYCAEDVVRRVNEGVGLTVRLTFQWLSFPWMSKTSDDGSSGRRTGLTTCVEYAGLSACMEYARLSVYGALRWT